MHQALIQALLHQLWTLQAEHFVDVDLEARAASVLSLLLRKWVKYYGKSGIEVDWRVAKRAIQRVCFRERGCIQQATQASMQNLARNTIKAVEKARCFFRPTAPSASVVEELWAELAPSIQDVSYTDCFQSLAYFSLLFVLPSDTKSTESDQTYAGITRLMPEWFAAWAKISKCSTWNGHWMKILSRVAKRYSSTPIWEEYLPFLFAKVHDMLELPSDLGAAFKSKTWPSAYMILNGHKRFDQYTTRMCVYILRNPAPDGTTALANQYMLDILNRMTAFFHPSNVANSANSLGVSVYFFSNLLAGRFGREKARSDLEEDQKLKLESCHSILDVLLKISFFGIYSKNRSVASKCMYLIKNIICIDPPHCAGPVLEEMTKALDPMAMSQSHMASTAISTMSVFLYHLMCGKHPQSTGLFFTTYLTPILQLTLPGIDPNDEKKTRSTVTLYFHLLSWLPLVNDSAKKADMKATKARGLLSKRLFDDMEPDLFAEVAELSADADQKMWELGAVLEEWALALLDRCFEFTKSRASATDGAGSSHSKADGASKQDKHEDPIVMEVLNMLGLLYPQMSPALYAQALRKTVSFTSNVFFTSAFGGRVINQVVNNCVQGNPSEAVPRFMPLVLEKLRVTKTSIDVHSLMANEKIWLLHLLDGIVANNGSRELLNFREELRVILSKFLSTEEDKEVYDVAVMVLEHVLKSLLSVYPTDFRSLPPTEWADGISEGSGMFQYLGTAVSFKKISIAWHEPNEQELAFGFELLQDHVLNILDSLDDMKSKNDTTVRTWISQLKRVHHGLQGAKNVLIDHIPATDNALYSTSLPLLRRELAGNEYLLNQYLSLKSTLMKRVHDIVVFWRENGNGSTLEIQLWHSLLSIIDHLLLWRGDHINAIFTKEKQNAYIKATTLDIPSLALRKIRQRDCSLAPRDAVVLASRNELVERVALFYSKRKVQEHYALARRIMKEDSPTRALYEALLSDVELLLKNSYEAVRSEASTVMNESCKLYPTWIYSRVPALITFMEGKDEGELKEESVMGVLQILSKPLVIVHLWKKQGPMLSRLLVALIKSNDLIVKRVDGDVGKVKVNAQLQALYLSILLSWRYVRNPERSTQLLEDLLAAEPASSEHWKIQLMHLVTLYPFLQPGEMPISLNVWKLIVRHLNNEVHPVRQVAVLLLAQLVKLYKREVREDVNMDTDEVTAFLYTGDTITVLLDAVVNNHKNANRFAASADGQHADSAPSNWSFGVNEVIQYLSNNAGNYPIAPPLSNVRLLSQPRDVFKGISLSNVKLIQNLVQINPTGFVQSGVFTALGELAADKIDSKIGAEDRQAVLTTLAEWIAGVSRGLIKQTSMDVESVQSNMTVIVDLLRKILPQLSVVLIEPWAQVFYLISRPTYHRSDKLLPLEHFQPILSLLLQELEDSFAQATAEDYARQVKWISLVESIAVHLLPAASISNNSSVSTMASELGERVLKVIREQALAHQYKLIRDRVAKMLFLLSMYGFTSTRSPSDQLPIRGDAIPLDQLAQATGVSKLLTNGSATEGEEEIPEELYAKETAMQWLGCTEQFGDTRDFLTMMPKLFPVAFLTQNNAKAEVALLSRHTTDGVASSLRLYYVPNASDISVSDMEALFALLEEFSKHRFWKTRAAVLRFLTTFSFYHWLFFAAEMKQRVQTMVRSFLTDEQREVQDMAKYALRSLLHNERPETVDELSTQWREESQKARVKYPKLKRLYQKQTTDEASEEELAKTRKRIKSSEDAMAKNVLGMSAIVLAFPYTLPSFVPPLFEELGKYLYLKPTSVVVSYLEKAVKETLLEFKRTHQENWIETKRQFTPAQLDVIEDVLVAPSYFS